MGFRADGSIVGFMRLKGHHGIYGLGCSLFTALLLGFRLSGLRALVCVQVAAAFRDLYFPPRRVFVDPLSGLH